MFAVSIQVTQPPDPINFAWEGASHFVGAERSAGRLGEHFVSKSDYLEYGHRICSQKYSNW